jgi:hypothetical protein
VVSWDARAFDALSVLDRAKVTGFELKKNTYATAKDMVIKKAHKIELTEPVLTLPWSLDQLLALFRTVVASRRNGRFALVTATLYRMHKQPRPNLPYTQYVLHGDMMGHSGYGRFYGSLADAAEHISDGTVVTLVQPRVELEGDSGTETVIVTLDDTYEPICAIATAY